MKARYKIAFCFFAAFIFIFFALPVAAEEPPSVASASGFALYNIENNLFIMQKNADEKLSPSSSVKIMAGLVAYEHLAGRLDETVTLTQEMLQIKDKLDVGKSVKIRDLFTAALSGRSNDASNALAVISCGKTGDFIEKMNEKAKSLGMTDTVYASVSGFGDKTSVTTVKDTVKLCVAASKIEFLLEASSNYTFDITYGDGAKAKLYNTNQLINKNSTYYCRSAKGLNSGSGEGGYSLATYAVSKGASYVVVYFGEGQDKQFALAQDALQFAYDNYGYKTLEEAGKKVGTAAVTLAGSDIEIPVVLSSDLKIYEAKNADGEEYTYDLRLFDEALVAPVEKGETVGIITVWQGQKLLGSAYLLAGADASPNAFLVIMLALQNYFTGRAFIASLVIAALIVVISIVSMFVARYARNKKRVYVRSGGGFKLK